MKDSTERTLAVLLSVLAAFATVLPYLLAARYAEPANFTGFLINPIDGFSYLAKMQQGAGGGWFFRLPYAATPGPGAFLFVYYLMLGHLARLFNTSLLTIFHLARFFAASGMFWLAYLFYERFTPGRVERWTAFVLTLVGAGLGWLALPFGVQASDLSIPESIPFLTAYSNAHFPLAAALLLGAVLCVSGRGRLVHRGAIALLIGSTLGVVLPFSLASLLVVLGLWSVWEFLRSYTNRDWRHAWRQSRDRILPFLGLLLGASPWLLYGYWLSRSHPVISAWSAQNLTPSPPIHHYLIGFGTILPLAIVGMLMTKPQDSPRGRLLLTWSLSNAVLLYAPIGLQRRLSLGLYFPLACLAAMGLKVLVSRPYRYRLALFVLLILSLPSNLIIIGAGLTGVRNQDPNVIHTPAEVGAYTWIDTNLPAESLILAAPATGNRLPAYANVRVLYGHPFETPSADEQEALVLDLFRWEGNAEEGFERLKALGVDSVFYGARERAIGEPSWLARCIRIHRSQEVELYEVVEP